MPTSIAKVTAADVQRVAKQYLVKTERTVVVTVPEGRAAGEGRPVMTTPRSRRRDSSRALRRDLARASRGAHSRAAVADAGLVKKGKAPVSNEVLKVKLPKPDEADLPNGLHLMVLEDHRLPQVRSRSSFPAPAATTIPPT